jgi:hypothetical protein
MPRNAKHKLTPSLFDALDDVAQEADVDADELDDWEEVPQQIYMTWSHAMQLHYCYQRDLDSALRCSNDDDATWFLWRAGLYKAQYERLLTNAIPAGS